jgi:hypothetical protein
MKGDFIAFFAARNQMRFIQRNGACRVEENQLPQFTPARIPF